MRVELELDIEAYVKELMERGWNVGGMPYQDLAIRLRMAMSQLLQDQIDDQRAWYLDHCETELGLAKRVKRKGPRPKQQATKAYKIIRED